MAQERDERFQRVLNQKAMRAQNASRDMRAQGIGPNKAAGRKGGIRRQGSKRG